MLRRAARNLASSASRRQDSEFRMEPAMAGTMLDIGCRRIFDEDHDAFRDMARKWFETEVRPHHGDWEKTGVVPREVWENAGENFVDVEM